MVLNRGVGQAMRARDNAVLPNLRQVRYRSCAIFRSPGQFRHPRRKRGDRLSWLKGFVHSLGENQRSKWIPRFREDDVKGTEPPPSVFARENGSSGFPHTRLKFVKVGVSFPPSGSKTWKSTISAFERCTSSTFQKAFPKHHGADACITGHGGADKAGSISKDVLLHNPQRAR